MANKEARHSVAIGGAPAAHDVIDRNQSPLAAWRQRRQSQLPAPVAGWYRAMKYLRDGPGRVADRAPSPAELSREKSAAAVTSEMAVRELPGAWNFLGTSPTPQSHRPGRGCSGELSRLGRRRPGNAAPAASPTPCRTRWSSRRLPAAVQTGFRRYRRVHLPFPDLASIADDRRTRTAFKRLLTTRSNESPANPASR